MGLATVGAAGLCGAAAGVRRGRGACIVRRELSRCEQCRSAAYRGKISRGRRYLLEKLKQTIEQEIVETLSVN